MEQKCCFVYSIQCHQLERSVIPEFGIPYYRSRGSFRGKPVRLMALIWGKDFYPVSIRILFMKSLKSDSASKRDIERKKGYVQD
ncbi:MAG: hypothetical protein DRH32_06425 [Deltaproteobacteria bacterium]|nr:MAG: hypothetical protein DRH32_06425 [Deltaproteobacteria bacterium]